jgi:hypothetical protein
VEHSYNENFTLDKVSVRTCNSTYTHSANLEVISGRLPSMVVGSRTPPYWEPSQSITSTIYL